jgi:hypothetical protein
MRLTYLLIDNEQTVQPNINALFALMCFHSSRFKARKNEKGEMILYEDQDETLWDQELIAKGTYHLHQAAQGESNFKISSRSDHRLLEHSEIRQQRKMGKYPATLQPAFAA